MGVYFELAKLRSCLRYFVALTSFSTTLLIGKSFPFFPLCIVFQITSIDGGACIRCFPAKSLWCNPAIESLRSLSGQIGYCHFGASFVATAANK